MVLEVIFEIIVRPFFELLIWLTLYLTAWIITPILSCGFVRVEGRLPFRGRSNKLRFEPHLKVRKRRTTLSLEESLYLGFAYWVIAAIIAFMHFKLGLFS